MSKILKRIIYARKHGDDQFATKEDGRIYEKLENGSERFTGYFQDQSGTYYREPSWLKQKANRIKKRYAKRRAKVEGIAPTGSSNTAAQKTDSNSNKPILLSLSVFAVVIVAVVFIFYNPLERNPQKKIAPEIIKEQPPTLPKGDFGNAIVTGSNVNLRSEASTDSKVLDYFKYAGERLQVIDSVNVNTQMWYKINRENGISGWVYGTFVLPYTVSDTFDLAIAKDKETDLIFYKEPSTTARTMTIPVDEEFKVASTPSVFSKAQRFNGEQGYVMGRDIDLITRQFYGFASKSFETLEEAEKTAASWIAFTSQPITILRTNHFKSLAPRSGYSIIVGSHTTRQQAQENGAAMEAIDADLEIVYISQNEE